MNLKPSSFYSWHAHSLVSSINALLALLAKLPCSAVLPQVLAMLTLSRTSIELLVLSFAWAFDVAPYIVFYKSKTSVQSEPTGDFSWIISSFLWTEIRNPVKLIASSGYSHNKLLTCCITKEVTCKRECGIS